MKITITIEGGGQLVLNGSAAIEAFEFAKSFADEDELLDLFTTIEIGEATRGERV